MKKIFIALLVLGFVPLYAQSSASAQLAANEALSRLDEALNGSSSGSRTARSPVLIQATRGGQEPPWVNNPYTVYSQDHYFAAVGSARNRNNAEERAVIALAGIFNRSIQSDFHTSTIYSEAVSNGTISVSRNTNVRDVIITAVSMDNLIGAEIGYIWEDGRGTVYALAYIEREKAIEIYTELIRINQINIDNITAMNAAERNTFDGYARYKLAALIAGINSQYSNIILLAGGSTSSLNLSNAAALNQEAANIIKNISVGLNVMLSVSGTDATGDIGNRIQSSFARILTGAGLRTHGNNNPYTLRITFSIRDLVSPESEFKFCIYELNAELIENAAGTGLLQFSASGREGHLTFEGARNRAMNEVEARINEQFPARLKGYLDNLLPR
jgi:hypothetical protein